MSDEADIDVPAIPPPDDAVIGDPSARGAVEEVDPLYRRVVNDKTRTLFKAAAERIKAQIDAGDGHDDDEPAIQPPDDKPAAAAAVASPGTTQAATSQAAAAAPALDAASQRAALQLEVREKSIAEREKALQPYTGLREKFLDGSAKTIRELVKEWTGAATDDEIKDEVADLISELSTEVLGLGVSQEIKTRLESRRAIRQVKSYKADLTKREQEHAKQVESEQQKQREALAVNAIGEQLKAAAATYPHLMSEDDPHAIVWDVIKTKAEREPDWVPNWEQAAKLANDHFKSVHENQHKKLTRLFTPAATTPTVEAQHQGAAQSRAARTLTNASTAPIPAEKPVDPDEPYDREAHRRRSLGKLRARMQEPT